MLPKPVTRSSLLAMAAGLGIACSSVMQPLQAATDVALVSGAFRRSIPVKEFEHLAETGEAIGLLEDLLELSGQDSKEVSQMLNQSLELPLVLTSRTILHGSVKPSCAVLRASSIRSTHRKRGQCPGDPRRGDQWIAK